MVKYVIKNNLMPPWFVSKHTGPWENDFSLSSKEKQILLKWIEDGLPYKNKDIKLTNLQKIKTIKNPDYVIKLETPVKIPATGFIPYKSVISIPPFLEDKWIKEIEFVLKPKVIHHIILTILDKKLLPKLKPLPMSFLKDEIALGMWGVGHEFFYKYDQDIGEKIPKNHILIARIHYEPIGKKTIDTETQIKLRFYSKPPKYTVFRVATISEDINIDPYQNNYINEMSYTLKKDMPLKEMSTHMHLRGKSSSILLRDPKGYETEIFKIDPYYFNFQRMFSLKKALFIKKGSTLICRNYFDNSKENPVNPDPSKSVKAGSFTEDEMSDCYFHFLIPTF